MHTIEFGVFFVYYDAFILFQQFFFFLLFIVLLLCFVVVAAVVFIRLFLLFEARVCMCWVLLLCNGL